MQVRVKILDDTNDAHNFTLRPGGGLEGHVRRDTTQQAASGGKERVLTLANMNVGIYILQLLMEMALSYTPSSSTDANSSAVLEEPLPQSNKSAGKNSHFSDSLLKASKSLQKLSASKIVADGEQLQDGKDMVQSIELNQNPLIGHGKGVCMKLIVQIAQLTAGRYLLRLHLDNNNIEDEGTRVLTRTLKRGFAPCLKMLWLSENCITDYGARLLGETLETSLECLSELYLFR